MVELIFPRDVLCTSSLRPRSPLRLEEIRSTTVRERPVR